MVASQPARRETVKEDLLTHARKMMEQAKAKEQRLAAESELAVLEAQFAIEEMEAKGDKKSDTWKEAALNLVKLQRQSVLENARWNLISATQEQQAAQQALENAEAQKKKSVITKAKQRLKKAEQQHKTAETALKKAETDSKAKLTTKYSPRKQPVYPKSSSGRRLACGRWLTDGKNPWTARVAMNHIWLRHCGQPIVPTVNEFGGNGRGPTHPALLDWLAAELVKQDWSMKEMHRLIVTSSTYRMAGTGSKENHKIDPDNKYYWKKSAMRMEGEIVRDNLIYIPGRLDPQLGGPDIDNTQAQDSVRKSIYLRHAHEKLVEFVQIFDGPSVTECYMRDMSVQPHQALAMANSRLTFQATEALTQKLLKQTSGKHDDFIQQAFLSILSRHPDVAEQKMCREFLTHASESSDIKPSTDQFQQLVTVLFNHNDFVTIR